MTAQLLFAFHKMYIELLCHSRYYYRDFCAPIISWLRKMATLPKSFEKRVLLQAYPARICPTPLRPVSLSARSIWNLLYLTFKDAVVPTTQSCILDAELEWRNNTSTLSNYGRVSNRPIALHLSVRKRTFGPSEDIMASKLISQSKKVFQSSKNVCWHCSRDQDFLLSFCNWSRL